MAEKKKEEKLEKIRQAKGKLTGIGTQVSQAGSTMYVMINNNRINIEANDIVEINITEGKK